MSIIYEALKKVEESNSVAVTAKIDKTDKPKYKYKIYLLYGLVACVGFLITNILWTVFSKPLKIKSLALPKNTPQIINTEEVKLSQALPQKPVIAQAAIPAANQVQEEPPLTLVLNGIFFSQDEGYALVNNQIVKEGDTVEGALVKRIGPDEVDLDAKGSNIKLCVK